MATARVGTAEAEVWEVIPGERSGELATHRSNTLQCRVHLVNPCGERFTLPRTPLPSIRFLKDAFMATGFTPLRDLISQKSRSALSTRHSISLNDQTLEMAPTLHGAPGFSSGIQRILIFRQLQSRAIKSVKRTPRIHLRSRLFGTHAMQALRGK